MASSRSEENHHLIGLARRRAFETYLRYGRMPAERKAVNPAIPTPTPLPARATRYYVWRSAGDDRVRHSHARRDGQVFAWAEPPEGGHPGTEPNCRCWPEPYYGDPSVPDALQPLAHHHQVGDGTTEWSSIETLTRPDGSLAQSFAVSRDGTQIRSQFQATSITRTVTLASGQTVRIDTESGLQSVYLGDDSVPQFQSRWTAKGPKLVRARRHVAYLLDRDQLNVTPNGRPEQMLTGPGGGGGAGDFGMGAIARALASLFFIQQAAPTSQGLGTDDVPFLALRAWVAGADTGMVPYMADAIAQERIRKHCTLLPDVQSWTNEAALAAGKPVLSDATAVNYGKALHLHVKNGFDLRKATQPVTYRGVSAEYSVDAAGMGVRYGLPGSTRLDLVQLIPADNPEIVCIYEIKTGAATVRKSQRELQMLRLWAAYPEALIILMQVKPDVDPVRR